MRVAAIGDSAFTVTPGGTAFPICHVRAATARFAQLYAPAFAGRHPEPEVTPRIRPCPAAAMIGKRRPQHVQVPVEVHAQHRRPGLLVALGVARGAGDAGDVDHRVETTELVGQVREQRVDRRRVGDRRVRRPRRAAGRDDAVGGRLRRRLVVSESVDGHPRVDGDDVGAGAPDRFGDGGTDPGPSPRHDDDLLPIRWRCGLLPPCSPLLNVTSDDRAQRAASAPSSSRRPANSPLARQCRNSCWYAKKSPNPPR